MDRFDAGCIGCSSLLVLASSVLGLALADSPWEAASATWSFRLGLAGVVVAVALWIWLSVGLHRRRSAGSREDARSSREGSSR